MGRSELSPGQCSGSHSEGGPPPTPRAGQREFQGALFGGCWPRCDLWLARRVAPGTLRARSPEHSLPNPQPPSVLTRKTAVSGSGEGAGPGLQVQAVVPQPRGQDRSSVFGSPCSLDVDLTPSPVGAETSSLGVWQVRCESQWPNSIFKDISYLFILYFYRCRYQGRIAVFPFSKYFFNCSLRSILLSIGFRCAAWWPGSPALYKAPEACGAAWPECRARSPHHSSSRTLDRREERRSLASALLSREESVSPQEAPGPF